MTSPALHVAVGSRNPVKIAAVRAALALAGIAASVTSSATESGVPDQPIGYAQIAHGAETRARSALRDCQADWGVGMEAGVEFDHAGACWLYNVIVILTADGRMSQAQGGRLLLPPAVARRVATGEELGLVIDELTGIVNSKQQSGAVGFLTGGVIRREDAYRDDFGRALAPLLHPGLYFSPA